MFRLEVGDWVAREVVKDIKGGNAKFVVTTGDLVRWGKQGGNMKQGEAKKGKGGCP